MCPKRKSPSSAWRSAPLSLCLPYSGTVWNVSWHTNNRPQFSLYPSPWNAGYLIPTIKNGILPAVFLVFTFIFINEQIRLNCLCKIRRQASMERMDGHKKATLELFLRKGGLAAWLPLNRLVFVKRKHNLLSAGADHVSPIIIVYQVVVWLFSCGLWGFSIRYLPAVLPIKG